jgi:hypothetical protein
LWLLKSPQGLGCLDATLSRLVKSAKSAGLDIVADRAFVHQVRGDLDGLFGSGS